MNQSGNAEFALAPSAVGPRTSSLLAWLPFLWSRVLFPGSAATRSTPSIRSLCLLLLVPGVLLYPCLSFHLFEPDEGRYAEISREMLVRGEWIVPYLQREPYLDKPPLLYWLVMLSYAVFGVHTWAARLVPALAVHGCVMVTYWLGRRSLGERAAFWGALVLGLAPGFISMGRLLVLDGLLSLCVALALFSAFEAVRGSRLRWGWWLLAAVACGFGVLAKGPVALVLLVPPLWAHSWLSGTSCRVGWRASLVLASILLVLVLPWYVAVGLRRPEFFRYFFWEHNVIRFMTPFDHQRPIWFYAPILFFGLVPASFLLLPFARHLLSGDPVDVEQRCPALGFMLLAGGWCVGFFSLSGCKLPTYVMPGFPPLALALGYYIASTNWRRSHWFKGIVGINVVLLMMVHYVAVPWYARFHSPLSRPEEVASYCQDPQTPVVCYPRNCDSVAFFLGRDDFRSYRSKETPSLIRFLLEQPRTVILFTHRHSLDALRQVLPPGLRLTSEVPLSGSWRSFARPEMCYMAVVERK